MTHKVLVVDDDAEVRAALVQTLELADIDVVSAGSFVEAKDYISRDFSGVILSDIRMPGRDGFYLLEYALAQDSELPVILLTGEGDVPTAVSAMGKGAFGFLEKPCAASELLGVLEQALKTRDLVLENRRLKAQLERGDPAERLVFGVSDLANDLRAQVRRVAATNAEVLITGALGSGISKIAEVIHLMSPQAQSVFEKRAASTLDLAAFHAAFESSINGTFFIDGLVDLPSETQFAMLDSLEKGNGPRIITGTNIDLQQAVANGDFNADLYYLLDVMRVRIPSLAERPEDIPVLFRHYVAQASEQAGLQPPEISSEHIADLLAQSWPGNTRALMSAAMRFVLAIPDGEHTGEAIGLSEQMARVERTLLVAALGRHSGNATETAKSLRLPRKTFYDKLTRYNLRPDDYRN